MTNEKAFIRPALALTALALIIGLIFGSQLAFAAPPKFSLEQCRNGSATSPNNCPAPGGGSGWVSGNAGASQAHFVEGHSIAYRGIATDMPTNTGGTITLGYDIKHSGKHAIDFLTHYDRLQPHSQFGHDQEAINPVGGVNGAGAAVTCAIEKPGNLSTGAGATFDSIAGAGKGVFTIFGATSCSTAVGTAGDVNASQSEATIVVTWTCNPCTSTMVFAWGGHIARSADWPPAGGAAGISGSPYHMRTNAWSVTNIGNQDRSLSAAAVVAENTGTATQLQELDSQGTPTSNVGLIITAALGASVRDTATVTPAQATGSVAFSYYSTLEACNLDTTGTGGTSAGSGNLPGSSPNTAVSSTVILAAGDYWWRAFYTATGDFVSSVSACNEKLTVSKGTPGITTNIHEETDHTTNYDRNAENNGSASLAVGSKVHDVAFVTGVTGFAPTGAITFTMYNNATCTDGTGSALATGAGDEGGTGTRSVDTSALSPGDYSFTATIAADTNYNTATSACESLKIDQASPTLTTAPWFYPQDSGTISGLANPQAGSTLTFTLHTANDCSVESQVYSEVIDDVVNNTYDTTNDEYKITSDTTVYWKVAYSGDANNTAQTSDCVESIAATIVTDPVASDEE